MNIYIRLSDINNHQNWINTIEYKKPGLKEYYENETTHELELKGEIFNSYTGVNKNIASGFYSHAEGNSTIATGDNSHSSGYNTIAYNDNMTAIGQYNISGNKSDNDEKIFVVGNGSDENNRSDAFVVKDNGVIIGNNILTRNCPGTKIYNNVLYKRGFSCKCVDSFGNYYMALMYYTDIT